MRKLFGTLLTATALAAAAQAGGVLSPPAASAADAHEFPCHYWDLSNAYIIQSNGWYVVMGREGGLMGSATAYDNYNRPALRGTVEGDRSSPNVHFKITWSNGSVGIYDGRLYRYTTGPSGDGDGTTYDQANPWSRATWRIYNDARCVW